MRTRQKADPHNGRFPPGAIADVPLRTDLCPLEPTSRPRREAVPASEFRPGKKFEYLSGGPMVRIHLPPAVSPVRTHFWANPIDARGEFYQRQRGQTEAPSDIYPRP